MLKNYLITAFKNIRKQKVFSLINILGLTLGISCCFLIYLFLQNELSFDNFHPDGNRIYRVERIGKSDGERREIPYLSPPYTLALKTDYPDAIEETVRIFRDNALFSYGNSSYNEKQVIFADSNLFSFFAFPLLRGKKEDVLKDPNNVVLSSATAKKYFGKEDPVGKVIELNKDVQLKVAGICRDLPVNSHLQFDIALPMRLLQNFQPGWFDQWPSNGLFGYVKLAPHVNPLQLQDRFPAFMDKYMGEFYAQSGFKMDLEIQPLSDIYFASGRYDPMKHGNWKTVVIFMSVAILILVVACINFVNLATARAADRSREVGIRKVMGAVRKQLAGQFLMESLLFAAIACLLSLGVVQLAMPTYEKLLGYSLPGFWTDSRTYLFLGAVVLAVGLLAGIYPALLMSSFSPIESIKGKLKLGKSGNFFRQSLVVLQFGISVVLIISVIVISRQLKYMQHTDLGFDKSQTMIVRFDNTAIGNDRYAFEEALKRLPSVEQVSLMSGEPGGFHDGYGFSAEGKPEEKFMFNTEFTDFNFVKTLGLKIIAGRDFSASYGTDSTGAVLINRNAATALGYTPEQAIGKWISNNTRDTVRRTIVGVVENYHYASMKEEIGKLVITPGNDKRLALIKIATSDLQGSIASVKKIYGSYAPDYPFAYEFLDERFNQLYKAESGQQSVMNAFSVLAILIACLGLFGLSSFAAVKRTKEIGIRKVIGSSVNNIVLLLSKDLLKPVLLGIMIALPTGYYLMHQWLEGFVYRVQLSWWIFILAIVAAFLIAFTTISFQAVKAALANPVKSLRTE